MEPLKKSPDLEVRRMELRGSIRLASEVIGQYWPMRTFVHHNPLHSLEYLPFDETIQRGRQYLGGAGYLSGERYREYLRSGRIQIQHLDEALKPLALRQSLTLSHGPNPARLGSRSVKPMIARPATPRPVRASSAAATRARLRPPPATCGPPPERGAVRRRSPDAAAPVT